MESVKPNTLMEAIRHYADADAALSEVADSRWPKGVLCQHCGAEKPMFLKTRRIWKCSKCRKQFSIKTKSVFEDSAISLDKWLAVVWMVANCKNGVSSYEIMRDLGVTQKTAWFMLHRIRLAMREKNTKKLGGADRVIEADETFVGGKVEFMHKRSRARVTQFNNWGKTPVLGLLERESRKVRAAVAPNRKRRHVHPNVTNNVELGSTLMTDDYIGYDGLPAEYKRELVNHLQQYVNGRVHVNGLENFWSLLKRALKGTYVSVDPCHLQAYVDEQVFRYNNRKHENGEKQTDFERFKLVLSQIVDKRLTYAELIGKEGETLTVVD
jgi:transposase-like protein